MLSYLEQNARRITILLLLALCYRFWFCTTLQLVPDEAYYWLWSKHLAASYRDKGPAIAWTIALGTKLFGNTVFGIRFFAVLLSILTSWLVVIFARKLYDDRIALWSLMLSLAIPMLAVGSILMTIDSLSLFFWALGVILFWNALQSGKLLEWFLLGAIIGLGFLAKFTNVIQLGCIGLFLLWSKEHRRLLFSWKMFVMLFAFALFISPVIWWNMQTGWIHFEALHSRSGVKSSFQIQPGELFTFLLQQLLVLSPLIAIGIVVAALGLLAKKQPDLKTRFLLSHFFPVYGLFLFFSLNKAGKPNWIAPGLVTGMIFTVVFWRDIMQRRPAWRWGIGAALVMGLLIAGVLHAADFLTFSQGRDPLHRAKGWTDFATHIEQARVKYKTNLLLARHYTHASMMSFYLPDQPDTYLLPEPYGKTQFSLWPGYEVRDDTRALFVIETLRAMPEELVGQFPKIELVDDFWSQHRGKPVTHYQIYLCSRN